MALIPLKRFRGSKAGHGGVNFVIRPGLNAYHIPILTTTRYVFVWTTIGLTRASTNIVEPATISTTAANQLDTGPNQTIDLREVSFNQHAAGMAVFTPFNFRNIGDNAVITGAEVLGQQADAMIWRAMREGAGSWNDGQIGSSGNPTNASLVENCRLVKGFDAIRLNLAVDNFLATVRGVYAKDVRDSFVQNPILRRLIIEDCLVDGCHQFLDMLPTTAIFNTRVVVIRNCLIRLRRYPYDTGNLPALDEPPDGSKFTAPWNSAASPGTVISPSGTGAGYSHDWLFRFNRTGGGGGGTPVGPTPANRPYPNSVSWQQINFPGGFTRQIQSADQHITSPYADSSMAIVACDRQTPSLTTLEIVRALGTFPNFQFTRRATFGEGLPHPPGPDPNAENLKGHALISLPNNRLLMYYYRLPAPNGSRRSIAAISIDNGVTFNLPAIGVWAFDIDDPDAFQPRGIVQAGPGYGATGSPPNTAPQYFDRDYIYLVGNNQTQGSVNANITRNGGIIYLCRYKVAGLGSSLNQTDLNDRSRYSFFRGRDANGVPLWTIDGGLKTAGVPIFRNILGGGADTTTSNEGVSYFFQISWHAALGQFIAVYSPNATGIAIAHAPTLWDENAWQMLCYHAQITGVSAAEQDQFIGASAPALWSSVSRIGIGASTYVEGAGGGDGDNLILTQSSPLVAIAGTTDSTTLTVDMDDCLVVCEGPPVDVDADWPPGTYNNVKVLWTGPGPWFLEGRADTPPGVTIEQTQNIAEWTTERNFWLQAHGDQTGTGNHFPFQDRPLVPVGGDVTLPTWPVSYTGPRYYVSAGSNTAALSTDPGSPAGAQHALDNAPNLSTIVFLGAGPYPNLTVNRSNNISLKMIADVPVMTGMRNLRPTSMALANLATLEDQVIINKNVTTSCRLRQFLYQNGGFLWFEGFRSDYPDNWGVCQNLGSSAGNSRGFWLEKCMMSQGSDQNFQVGPLANNTLNVLNVFHNYWSRSINEAGDPGGPGGNPWPSSGTGGAGTAVTDYGLLVYQNTGNVQVLESFFQMRANHYFSTKRSVGENTPGVHNRIEGCLFASWNRAYSRTSTILELGQEADDDGNDYTSFPIDVLNNTFVDPNGRVLYIKNQAGVLFEGNRVILQNDFILVGIDSGTAPSVVLTTVDVGPYVIRNNIIMDTSPRCTLWSVGQATTITFENNNTANVIPLTTRAAFQNPERYPNSTPVRITVNGDGVAGSGFGAAVAG